jgi:hypothetical protein
MCRSDTGKRKAWELLPEFGDVISTNCVYETPPAQTSQFRAGLTVRTRSNGMPPDDGDRTVPMHKRLGKGPGGQ